MGWIKMAYDWDWTGADVAIKRALELAPSNADVISGRSNPGCSAWPFR